MKKQLETAVTLLVISFVATASMCTKEDENHHDTIRFINKSDMTVYIVADHLYPDTLNNRLGGMDSQPQIYKVYPNTENKDALQQRDHWEVIFKDGISIQSDTLMVYVFNAKLLESHTTHINNTIIQRYDLSLQDLQDANWMLTYPPSPNMRTIKMWPPYGSK
ncbi:hypothetical protein [uncultured Bacteroides sp.]|uniref:hypothetical protein n=1 Tax=uncultured Bacteroides sp. TaxID=162156 RepID=UPI002AAAE9B4|nr:hypothetical protein [uncultured Bacteroides sp.]